MYQNAGGNPDGILIATANMLRPRLCFDMYPQYWLSSIGGTYQFSADGGFFLGIFHNGYRRRWERFCESAENLSIWGNLLAFDKISRYDRSHIR